jgi:hypothetical protein
VLGLYDKDGLVTKSRSHRTASAMILALDIHLTFDQEICWINWIKRLQKSWPEGSMTILKVMLTRMRQSQKSLSNLWLPQLPSILQHPDLQMA